MIPYRSHVLDASSGFKWVVTEPDSGKAHQLREDVPEVFLCSPRFGVVPARGVSLSAFPGDKLLW